jgi:hypothetical protein
MATMLLAPHRMATTTRRMHCTACRRKLDINSRTTIEEERIRARVHASCRS